MTAVDLELQRRFLGISGGISIIDHGGSIFLEYNSKSLVRSIASRMVR